MSWFSRKKDVEKSEVSSGLPELPELPESTDKMLFEESEISGSEMPELPELPRFETSPLPDLPSSQNQIKQAINPEIDNMQKSKFIPLPPPREYESRLMPEPDIKSNIIAKPDLFTPIKTKPLSIQPPVRPLRPYQEQTSSARKTDSIYVKLDKFETSLQALEEIKDKIREIEKLLAKTKEIKAQEEKELEEWEREISIIKSRLDSIDKTVFRDLG